MRDTESITETQQRVLFFFSLSTDSQQVKDLRESYKTATEYLQNCKLYPVCERFCFGSEANMAALPPLARSRIPPATHTTREQTHIGAQAHVG